MKNATYRFVAIIVTIIIAVMVVDKYEYRLTRWSTIIMSYMSDMSFPHGFDANGVPMVKYNNTDGKYNYNPVYASIYGLHYYDEWIGSGANEYFIKDYHIFPEDGLSGDEYKERFIAVANWLKDNMVIKVGNGVDYGVWIYRFPWPTYKLGDEWVSGMAQGLGMQVLVRAWLLTRDRSYLEKAYLARNAFMVPVGIGGVTYFDSNDEYWYEEYAAPGAIESRVLNGHAHALISLWEMGTLVSDSVSMRLFDNGINSMRKSIGNYDSGWWSMYDAVGNVANFKYHNINYSLVKYIYSLTSVEEFDIYQKWENTHTNFFIREYYKQQPNFLDLAITGLALMMSVMIVLSGFFVVLAIRKLCAMHKMVA